MRALYFARAPPGCRKSCSWARAISRGASAFARGSGRRSSASDPALLTVPLQRAAEAIAQSDARVEAKFPARAADVERAALAEEVYTAAIDRRRHPERREDRLARRTREPEGPHRQ